MALGIGTDIVEIARISKLFARHGTQFSERILHPNEQAELSRYKNQDAFLAKRFAAKEAVGKALGTGLGEGVNAVDIEITHQENGRPNVQLHGQAAKQLETNGGKRCLISISDEKAYAVAFAIIE